VGQAFELGGLEQEKEKLEIRKSERRREAKRDFSRRGAFEMTGEGGKMTGAWPGFLFLKAKDL